LACEYFNDYEMAQAFVNYLETLTEEDTDYIANNGYRSAAIDFEANYNPQNGEVE
jgi:hypothetical protein